MKKFKPFIHIFNTEGGYYIFDVNKNMIIQTREDVYNLLKALSQENTNTDNHYEYSTANLIVEKMRENGFLSDNKIAEIIHPLDEVLPEYLESKISMITLQVTQQCNLRCNYCVYSGGYENRGHSNKRMSIETAKKGIDFLLEHSRDLPRVNIGFYGGEPIMEFELIKECISYAGEKGEGRQLTFSLTTNGTLLSEEIVEFFEQHDVEVMISLDGPKKIHDKNRTFASNGCGTFDKIVDNLENIKSKYPAYFKKISFNMVLDSKNDFGCVNEFFTNFDTIKELSINASPLNETYSKKQSDSLINEEFIGTRNYEVFKLLLNKLGRINEKHISPLVKDEYQILKKLHELELVATEKLPEKGHHGGPCTPGVQRLFMDANGSLFPCERVSESSSLMNIGDIENGIDVEKARRLLNIGKLTEENCKNCWAFRFCQLCAVVADDMTSFSGKMKLTHCKGMRETIEDKFKLYCTLKELGHDFEFENASDNECYI